MHCFRDQGDARLRCNTTENSNLFQVPKKKENDRPKNHKVKNQQQNVTRPQKVGKSPQQNCEGTDKPVGLKDPFADFESLLDKALGLADELDEHADTAYKDKTLTQSGRHSRFVSNDLKDAWERSKKSYDKEIDALTPKGPPHRHVNWSCNVNQHNLDITNNSGLPPIHGLESAERNEGNPHDDDVAGGRSGAATPEYNFDDDTEVTRSNDLSTFDFEHMTKREQSAVLSHSQKEYIYYCRMFKVIPNGYIYRNIDSYELRLCGHCLGRQRLKALFSALLNNQTVSCLEISEDEIDLKAMSYIVEIFSDNSSVEQMFLKDNKMGRLPVKLLLDYLSINDQLFYLSLARNQLMDTDGDILYNYISVTANLGVLDLSYNHFESMTADWLCKAFTKNTSVHTLSLRWNHWSGEALRIFLACLVKNRTLVNLDLSWNGFTDRAVTALCKALRVNDALTNLEMVSCNIRGNQLMEIVAVLKKNLGLRSFCLGGNIISCLDAQSAFKELANSKAVNLKELDLGDSSIFQSSLQLIQLLMQEKDLMVYHGNIIGKSESALNDADMLAAFNPVTVLIEFGSLQGMNLKELFDFMDDDDSGTLTRDEIKDGLLEFDIPLSEQSLDILIRRMDRDGDGVISFPELLAYGQVTSRSRMADILSGEDNKEPSEIKSTTNSGCRKILKRMLAEKEEKIKRIASKPEMDRKTGASNDKLPPIENDDGDSDDGMSAPQ